MKKSVIILGVVAFIASGCGGLATKKNINNMTDSMTNIQTLEMLAEGDKQTILHDPEIKILGKENCLKGEPPFEIGDYTACTKILFEDGAYQINAYQMFDDFSIYDETLYNKDDRELLRRYGRQLHKSTYDENGILTQAELFFLSEEGKIISKDMDFLYDNRERLTLKVEYYFGVESAREEYAYTDKGEKIVTYYFNYDDEGKPEYKEIVTYKDGKIINSKDYMK
jgi:hypothetical protein